MSHDNLNRGTVIKLRRDTSANWTIDNPVLEEGETGWETDTRRVKLGDGVTDWNSLPYAADEAADVSAETIRAEAAEAALAQDITDEQSRAEGVEAALAQDITDLATAGVFRSTDGSFGLDAPTGVGGELVVVANALDDIRFNGVSL